MASGEPSGERSGAPSSGRGAPRAEARAGQDDHEPPYEGTPGRTRLRSIHLPQPTGVVRTLQVYDVVNVGTDPHLREVALGGALHRFEDGDELAVPFVYHDPDARKLALVLPAVLRHEALRRRAELLHALSEDTATAVPGYVAEATVVIGVAALLAHLEAPAGGMIASALALREAGVSKAEEVLEQKSGDLDIQSDVLEQREERLQTRAEAVTRREDELRSWSEELEAGQADLTMREQELDARFEMLREREGELAEQRSDSISLRAVAADVQLVEDLPEPVEDLDDLEPLETSPGELPPSDERVDARSGRARRGHEAHPDDAIMLDDGLEVGARLEDAVLLDDDASELAGAAQLVDDAAEVLDAMEDVEEIVDDVEELEELEPIGDVTGLHVDPSHAARASSEPAPPEPRVRGTAKAPRGREPREERAPLRALETQISAPAPQAEPLDAPAAVEAASDGPSASVAPPPGLLDRRDGPELVAVTESGGVRLFARLPEGRDALFSDGPPELLAQLVVVEECPVVLLSVVERSGSRPAVLRAALDPRAAEDRTILENLRRLFNARLTMFSAEGKYLRASDVADPREVNVARILERVSRMRTAAAVDVQTAIGRVLSAPPPTRTADHPFVGADERESPKNAAEAAQQLARLYEWSSHDKMDHALLVLSIPRDVVDGSVRSVLEAAVEHGLPLPGSLSQRAVSLGVSSDATALISRQIEAFTKTSASIDRGGLDEGQLADAWEALLKSAADNEVAIDTDTHELAWKAIREVRGGDDDATTIDLAKLPEMGPPELLMLLEHPRYRRDAAIELARRQNADHAETICRAVRKMPRAEVVRVVPRLLEMGDGAGDALIDGLSARKTFVRQAYALALGHLKLRRAVVPLVHLLGSEESDVWPEIARVVGSFGTASLRNVTRQLRDPKGKEDRYILTLAHLANQGCRKQVEKLTQDDKPGVATMAAEAIALRERAKSVDDRVRGPSPLADEDPVLRFSRRFYEELEGKAPNDDLD